MFYNDLRPLCYIMTYIYLFILLNILLSIVGYFYNSFFSYTKLHIVYPLISHLLSSFYMFFLDLEKMSFINIYILYIKAHFLILIPVFNMIFWFDFFQSKDIIYKEWVLILTQSGIMFIYIAFIIFLNTFRKWRRQSVIDDETKDW